MAASDQAFAKLYFERAIAAGRLAHAYLLAGEEGSGKRRFALELAKALHCGEGAPCGQCASCRSIDHGNHAHVFVYGIAEGKSVIDIDTVRSMCERVQYTDTKLRVAILEDADSMSEPAANALLKTLEEPPDLSLLLLTVSSTGSLLPTIVSRCHRIPFMAPQEITIEDNGAAWVDDVLAADFRLRDVKAWLADVAPEAERARDQVRSLVDGLLRVQRRALGSATGPALDTVLFQVEELLALAAALDRSVHADLVLERLLRLVKATA